MEQTFTHDELMTTSTVGWMSYEELAEEFWEKPVKRTRPKQVEIIPENELPF
jgi:hypothetical protein